MSPSIQVTILGSGTSTGVPVIGCSCPVCMSQDPYNYRTRASIMLSTPMGSHLVIDTGPDFRTQMLRHNVQNLEHVLYTHTHADHCHGFDDLRAFYFHQKKPVHCYLHEEHITDFKTRFAYAFDPRPSLNSRPQVTVTPFRQGVFTVSLPDMTFNVEAWLLPHGQGQSVAFKIGSFVYATDFKTVPEEVRKEWRNRVHTMVASGVRFQSHPTHSSVPETTELMTDLGVRQGLITHLGHEIDYKRDAPKLPCGITLAYDGMKIDAEL